jgi:hypothetical protein
MKITLSFGVFLVCAGVLLHLCGCTMGRGAWKGFPFVLLKPSTYMHHSEPVAP